MSEKKLTVMPTLEDLLGAGAAAAMAAFQKMSPSREAVEQLVSQLVAKNLANYVSTTDSMTSNDFPLPVGESDMLTGVVRAGYGLSQSRANKAVLMDGLRGVFASVLGKELRKSFFAPSA